MSVSAGRPLGWNCIIVVVESKLGDMLVWFMGGVLNNCKAWLVVLFFFACPKKNQKKTPEVDIPADFGEALFGSCSLVARSFVILLLSSLQFNCMVCVCCLYCSFLLVQKRTKKRHPKSIYRPISGKLYSAVVRW